VETGERRESPHSHQEGERTGEKGQEEFCAVGRVLALQIKIIDLEAGCTVREECSGRRNEMSITEDLETMVFPRCDLNTTSLRLGG